MAATKLRMSNRISRDAYEILVEIHPSLRSDVLSDIVVRAEKQGWIDEIKRQHIEKLLEKVGMTIGDVTALGKAFRASDAFPADETRSIRRPAPESPEEEKSLQEKLDKKIFL